MTDDETDGTKSGPIVSVHGQIKITIGWKNCHNATAVPNEASFKIRPWQDTKISFNIDIFRYFSKACTSFCSEFNSADACIDENNLHCLNTSKIDNTRLEFFHYASFGINMVTGNLGRFSICCRSSSNLNDGMPLCYLLPNRAG